MKKTIRLLFGIFILTGLITKTNAQSGTVVAGGNASGTGGTASYSVGEVAYSTITSSGGIVIQGIQQEMAGGQQAQAAAPSQQPMPSPAQAEPSMAAPMPQGSAQ